MNKQTYTFAQYQTGQIAKCIESLSNFTTYGNLSGRSLQDRWTPLMTGYGWEGHHPVWKKTLQTVDEDRRLSLTWKPLYAVYSFNTCIAVLMEYLPTGARHWKIDAAAQHYSSFTSKAVSAFRGAIGDGWSRHGHVDAEHRYPIDSIGDNWVRAQRLSPVQRAAMGRKNTAQNPAHHNTVRSLRRLGYIDAENHMTEIGLAVAAYCVD